MLVSLGFFDKNIRVRLVPLIISVLVRLVPLNFNIRPGSLGPLNNIHSGSLGPFDINPSWFAWFLLLIYDSLVPLVSLIIIYDSLVPLIISWFA